MTRAPKKKPKSKSGLGAAFDRITAKEIFVTQKGRRKKISAMKLLNVQLVNDALAGDQTAQSDVLRMYGARLVEIARQAPVVTHADDFISVMHIGPYLNRHQWEAVYSGPQPQPTHPLLEKIRRELEGDFSGEPFSRSGSGDSE